MLNRLRFHSVRDVYSAMNHIGTALLAGFVICFLSDFAHATETTLYQGTFSRFYTSSGQLLEDDRPAAISSCTTSYNNWVVYQPAQNNHGYTEPGFYWTGGAWFRVDEISYTVTFLIYGVTQYTYTYNCEAFSDYATVDPAATVRPAPKIAAGWSHTCATMNGVAYCWGDNSSGQLGDNSTTERHTPVRVRGLTNGVSAIAAGVDHSCAIQNGAALCWGSNSFGQLGNNSTIQSLIPVPVQGLTSGVTAISVGYVFSCAIQNGAALCWGSNLMGSQSYGKLGNDSGILQSPIPVQVSGMSSGVTAISLGTFHACAVRNGAALCWGHGGGALGNNSTDNSPVPVQVSGLSGGVTAVSASELNSCALVSGSAKCWGFGFYGALGNNSTTDSLTPVQVQGLTGGVTAISAGSFHSCAVVNGSAQCWGTNYLGRLGVNDPAVAQSLVPLQVYRASVGVTDISAGRDHTCSVVRGGAQCWGPNYFGKLGNDGIGSDGIVYFWPFPDTVKGMFLDFESPTAPSNLVITGGWVQYFFRIPILATVDTQWVVSSDNVGVAGYVFDYCLGNGCIPNIRLDATYASPPSSVIVPVSGTRSLGLRVMAVDAEGHLSTPSNTVSASW